MAQQQKSTIDGLKRIFDKLLADRNNRDLLLELMKEIEKFDQNEVKLLKPEQRDAASATTSSYNNVMVVGPTAAGKSSLINTLLGKSLTVEFEKGSPETRLVKLLASSDGPVIGTGHNSETASVRAWIDEGKKTKYLDCPGLGDSRGVWQQIFNSLAMQNLKATENLKIMLVLPHNAFFDHTQAHNFLRETAQYLKSFFGDLNKIDNLRGSLVLVVTQGLKSETAEDETTSYAHSTPDQYLHKFQELSAQVTDPDTLALLHILSNAPIAVFPKILKADVVDGRLNPDLLTTWNGAIDTSINSINPLSDEVKSRVFNQFALEAQHLESLQILGDILNEFAAEKVRELAFEERQEVNTLLNNANNYLKLMGELEKKESEIKECLGAKEDPEGVVTEISVLSKQDEIKLPMKSILNTLKFLQKIKPSIKGESTRWVTDLEHTSEALNVLKTPPEEPIVPDSNGMLLIQAPILSISQIQDFYSRNPLVKFIKGSSFLFLADANLNALGVDLSVTSTVWNIGGKYKINLRSGNPKAKAGDFYGHATKVNNIGTEAKLVVDVSGTKGADGKFDISKIEAMEEQSAEYLNALKQKLKKYKEAQKQTDVSFHEDRILGYKARLLEIDGTIAAQKGRLDAIKMDIDRLAPEAILDKEKNKDLEVCEREYKRTSEEVSDLEFEKSSINKILEDLEDVTTLINKNETYIVVQLLKDQLSELEHLQSAAKNDQEISAEYLSVLDDLTNTKEKDLLVDYEALVDNVQKISEELKGRLKEDKHEKSAKEFEALGGESTVIQLRQEIADLEKEFDPNEKHKVYVSEGAIEFSLNEFIHIGEIIQELTAEIRNTNKQLDTHKKALKSLGKKIEKFNEADNKLKAIEASAKSREDNLRAEFEELNDRSDVSQKDLLDLKEAISKLFSSKTKFNEANTQFEACIARKDTTLSGHEVLAKKAGGKLLSNNKHNKKKFLEQYAQDKAKLKRESADLDKSYESVDIKLTKIELELKNNLNLALELKALNAKRLIGALKNAHNLDVEFNLPDEEKYNKVNEDLKVSTRNLESLYAQNSSILQRVKGLFRNDEELRLEMLKLMQEFKASKEKKEAYKQDMKARMAYAEDYEKELKNTEEEYNDAKSRMEEALSKFKKCKYKIDDESPLQNVLLCWNELEALHSSIEDKKQDVVMAAQVLLLDEINMVWSIKPQFKNMSTKEKTAHIAKEAFLFNTQFHEKYQISGSKGEEGGPAGYCIVNHDFLIIENHQGIGGKHASGLEGLREENYTLATLRGIRATHQDQGIGMAGAPVISVINGAAVQIAAAAIKPAATLLPKTTTLFAAGNGGIAATAVATAIPTWGLSLAVGGAMLLTQLLISPIVASTTSCWVDGPYQYDLGNAKNGVSNTSFVIINPQELNEEHSQYIISFLEQAGAVLCEENIFAALGIPINIDPFGCSFSNVDMHPPMQHMGQPAVMFDNADVV